MIAIQDQTIVQKVQTLCHSTTNLNIVGNHELNYGIVNQIFRLLLTPDGICLLQKYKSFRDVAQIKVNDVFAIRPEHQVLAAAEHLQTLISNIELGQQINAHELAAVISPVQV